MIHYDLVCGSGHAFDGWFAGIAAFDQQSSAGLLDCPICASRQVQRAIMAPRLSTGAAPPATPPAAGSAAERAAAGGDGVRTMVAGPPPVPAQLRAVLQRIRAEIEQKCDYVGPKFAEVARAIHEGAAPARPIYGESTPAEAEALADDGIEVARVPWIPRADS